MYYLQIIQSRFQRQNDKRHDDQHRRKTYGVQSERIITNDLILLIYSIYSNRLQNSPSEEVSSAKNLATLILVGKLPRKDPQ